jgi:hypothetical protein
MGVIWAAAASRSFRDSSGSSTCGYVALADFHSLHADSFSARTGIIFTVRLRLPLRRSWVTEPRLPTPKNRQTKLKVTAQRQVLVIFLAVCGRTTPSSFSSLRSWSGPRQQCAPPGLLETGPACRWR